MCDSSKIDLDAAQSALWHAANLARAAAAYACARMPKINSAEEEITLIVIEDLLKTIENDAVAAADKLVEVAASV